MASIKSCSKNQRRIWLSPDAVPPVNNGLLFSMNNYVLDLSDDERERYEELRQTLVLELPEVDITVSNAAVLSGKLLQMANGAIYDDYGQPIRMADCVGRIIDLENEIRNDMNELLDLKRKIMAIIKAVDNPEHQALLEKRYLCYLSWEKIAVDMGYDLRYIHKLHNRALENVKIPESDMKRH